MILSIEGQEATGKTTLALTAPLPIVMFSLDLGSERAIYGAQFEKFFDGLKIEVVKYKKGAEPPGFEGNDITIYQMPSPIQLDDSRLSGYMEQWSYFISVFAKAVQDDKVQTVIVDTMTLLRKNKCDAYLQELQGQGKPRKQLQQIEYGHPDGAIRTLYTYAQATGVNLIAIHHLREHYAPSLKSDGTVGNEPDGTYEIDGVKDTLRYVDVSLRNEKAKGSLTSKIMKCGPDLAYEGVPITNCTWDKLIDILEMNWHGSPYPRRHEK